MGDAVPAAAIKAVAALYSTANTKCGVQSQGLEYCAAIGGTAANLLTVSKARYFIPGSVDQVGPLIANNAACVQKTITMAFFGAASSVYGMIGATAAVIAMMF